MYDEDEYQLPIVDDEIKRLGICVDIASETFGRSLRRKEEKYCYTGEGRKRFVGTTSGRCKDCDRPCTQTRKNTLGLLEILENRVDGFESVINLLTNFRTSQDDLATNEDE